MRRAAALFALLLLPAPARAYSILWADDSRFDAALTAYTSGGQPVYDSVHDVSHSYSVFKQLSASGGSAFVNRSGAGIGSSGGGRFETDTAWLRTFWVAGGTGSTQVTMRWRIQAERTGASTLNSWLFGVDGVGHTSGFASGAHSYYTFAYDWTGTLDYGKAYTLRTEVDASSQSGRSLLIGAWDDAPGYPTPEPASLALLALGLALGATRIGRRATSKVA